MIRYLTLYLYCIRFSFSKAMEFRVDFFFRIVMDSIFYLVQFMFFKVIYLHTNTLGGWDESQIMIFVASYIFIDALNMTIFSDNCWMMPTYINRGQLDFYLTKPVSTLFFLSLREFAANSFVNLIFATSILIWVISNAPYDFSFLQLFLYFIFLLIGTFLYYIVHMFFILCVFWTHSSRGLSDFFWSFSHILERPDRIYKGFLRKVLVSILPFALMASFPTRILIEGDNMFPIIIHMTLVAIILFFIMLFIWKRGIRSYSSASS